MGALQKLIAADNDARDFGFNWPHQAMILKQIIDECREIKEEIDSNESSQKLQEEIGDLIHAALSLCLFSGFDVEETLQKSYEKFQARMQALKILTREYDLQTLQGQSTEFMLDLWKLAKVRVTNE